MSTVIKMRPYEREYPRWLVWWPYQGQTQEDAWIVEAMDSEAAAEDFAERWDSDGDCTILNGNEAEIHVCPEGGGEVERFSVVGEAVPQYTAYLIEEKAAG